MKLKKGQMEMMGLALIVILISIAMLFVIKFVILEKPADYKKEFTQKEVASNFINTLLETTNPDCLDLTFNELFQLKAEGVASNRNCQDPLDRKADEYLEDTVTEILVDTLEAWNTRYYFVAQTDELPPRKIYERSTKCPGQKDQGQFAIPIDASGATTLYVILDVCS